MDVMPIHVCLLLKLSKFREITFHSEIITLLICTVCETVHHEVQVDTDSPVCEIVQENVCSPDDPDDCKLVHKQSCEIQDVSETRHVPETECKNVASQICGPASCPVVKSQVCHDELRKVSIQFIQ